MQSSTFGGCWLNDCNETSKAQQLCYDLLVIARFSKNAPTAAAQLSKNYFAVQCNLYCLWACTITQTLSECCSLLYTSAHPLQTTCLLAPHLLQHLDNQSCARTRTHLLLAPCLNLIRFMRCPVQISVELHCPHQALNAPPRERIILRDLLAPMLHSIMLC